MNIPINKDFEHDYRETVFKGFTLHEAKYVTAGLTLMVSFCLFWWYFMGISPVLAVYISVPAGAPVVIAGFWKSQNGLTLKEHLAAVRYRKATGRLCYRAGEYKPPAEETAARQIQKGRSLKEQKKLHRKYVRAYVRKQRKEKKRGASA